jgi:hypothetical protein
MINYWRILALLLPVSLSGQYQFRQLNHIQGLKQEAALYDLSVDVHSSIRPLDHANIDTLAPPIEIEKGKRSWLVRKAFHENLVKVDEKKYAFTIDPIVNFQLGQVQGANDFTYINTRGFLLQGRIGDNFTFYSTYLENQGRFPDYINNFVAQRRVVPGQGSVARGFGNNGFDYGLGAGEISYNPNEFFTFTAGQGRNFFGEGYRSMLIGDGAFNYPFFRIETSFWKIKYVNLWAQLYDTRLAASPERGTYAKKFLSSHYLSININSRWNISFFEAIVTGDTAQVAGLDASFLNPVIFYRPVEFSVGSRRGNALLGFATSYKISDGLMGYGQFILDEFSINDLRARQGSWVNKFGWQLGLKYYNTFGLEGLFTRLEYNAVRPHTYQHREVLTNYAHYGSAFAHPWEANFHELVVQAIYQRERWEFDFQLNLGVRGLDSQASNWGTNVYITYDTREQDLNNSIGQGEQGNMLYGHLRLAYLVNPASGLKLEAGVRRRALTVDNPQVQTSPFLNSETTWFFGGLRTELFNRYYDF